MADSSPTYSDITAGLDALAAMTAAESVTPVLESALMRQIAGYFEEITSGHTGRLDVLNQRSLVTAPTDRAGHCPTLDADGLLRQSQLPAIPRQLLPSDTVFAPAMPEQMVAWFWNIMADDGYKSQAFLFCDDLEFPGQNVLPNGYYPDLHPSRPFFLHGAFYSVQQAAEILLDRWVLGSGGIMQRAHANIPQDVKSSDSRITMAYTATNNWNPYTIAIGVRGVRSEVEPTSIYRAFHGAGALRAVIGTISLKRVTSQFEASSAFLNCPELRFVLLRRIADCITELDLSGCSPLIAETMRFDDADRQMSAVSFNPVRYLLENIDDPDRGFYRDPDAPLLIKFPDGVATRIMDTPELMNAYRAARESHPGLRVDGMLV